MAQFTSPAEGTGLLSDDAGHICLLLDGVYRTDGNMLVSKAARARPPRNCERCTAAGTF